MKTKTCPEEIWETHWRIRDEILFRKGAHIKNKYIKRKGGYFNKKDQISKLPTNVLKELDYLITKLRENNWGDAST